MIYIIFQSTGINGLWASVIGDAAVFNRNNSLSTQDQYSILLHTMKYYYLPKYQRKSWKFRWESSNNNCIASAREEFASQIIRHISSTNAFGWKVASINWPTQNTIILLHLKRQIHTQYKPLWTMNRTDGCWMAWCVESVLKRSRICGCSRVPCNCWSSVLSQIPRNKLNNKCDEYRLSSWKECSSNPSWYIMERNGWSINISIWLNNFPTISLQNRNS
jgi:hypothetical protein